MHNWVDMVIENRREVPEDAKAIGGEHWVTNFEKLQT
jgi:hypothetical protein